jgi:large subunit ribosomal protein L20
MPRATNAVARKRRKKKVLSRAKGYFGRKHSSYRFANEQLMRSDSYAYRDRRTRKRDFRRLWITRINAAARQEGMSYSQLIHGLSEAGVDVNRKMLADIAVNDPEGFRRFVELAREAAATKSKAAISQTSRAVREAEPPFFISGSECRPSPARTTRS